MTFTTKRKGAVLLLILSLLTSAAPIAGTQAQRNVAPLDPKATANGSIFKWVRPVRVSLAGAASEEQRSVVAEKAELFRKITGHDIETIEEPEGNLVLVFGTGLPIDALALHTLALAPLYADDNAMRSDLEDDGDQDLCIAKRGVSPDNHHEVVYAVGLIPAELDGKNMEACIERQFASALAFSVDKGRPLAKNANAKPNAGLANFLQAVTLKAIYDDRVKPGMSAAEAQPIITEVTLKAMQNVN